MAHQPRYHLLDRRALALVAAGADSDPNDVLDQKQMSEWFGLAESWFEFARHKGFGPPFMRPTLRTIRYRKRDVIKWLRQRARAWTARQRGRSE